MSVAIASRAIELVSQALDPKKAILDMVGDLDDVEVMGEMVLIGVYFRPEKTKGGIIRPTVNVEEDAYQGKVGLVLKWGGNAFRDPRDGQLYDQRADVGQWCVFKVGDAWSLNVRGYPCRLVRDANIRSTIKDPSIVF